MLLSEAVKKYEIENAEEFENFVKYHKYKTTSTGCGLLIPDDVVKTIVDDYNNYPELRDQAKKATINSADLERRKKIADKTFLMSSTPFLEGYKVTQNYGVVFGEVVYKVGLFNRLMANVENIGGLNPFGSELTGDTDLIDNARKYSLKKMRDEAIERGANAIIGMNVGTTYSGEISHITAYGTAVCVEKVEE